MNLHASICLSGRQPDAQKIQVLRSTFGHLYRSSLCPHQVCLSKYPQSVTETHKSQPPYSGSM